MEGPFVDGGGAMGMDFGMGAMGMGADMERWFEDYEWSICWDFEMNSSWGAPKPAPNAWPSWMMPMGAKGSGPPGPPPGPPPGSGWGKGNSWGNDFGGPPGGFDGPYMGDANNGDSQEDSWGGGWGKGGKGGSQSWGSGRGRSGGKDWPTGPIPEDQSWGGGWKNDWKQDSWNNAGKGRGKGEKGKKGGDAQEWGKGQQDWGNDGWGKGGKKGDKGGKDGKGAGKDAKGEAKGGKSGKKGDAGPAQWKPREDREQGAPEGDGERKKGDKAQDEVMEDIDALVEAGSNLEKGDFDFRVRKYLFQLRNSGGRQKVKDALAMITTYTAQKSRESVKNWPAYLLTLLKKLEPEPMAKGKGKGRGGERDQDKEDTRAAAKSNSKKAAAPVAAGAGAAAAPGGDGEVEVVQATEELPSSAGAPDPPRPSVEMSLPPGWEDGRSSLHEEIQKSLLGGSSGQLRNPFTSQPLDIEATLVSNVVACLNSSASQPTGHHLVGFARSHELIDLPRAASASAMIGGSSELGALPDNASAMDAAAACTAAGAATAAATVLQEIALELTAEVLRNPQLGSVTAE